MDQERNRRKMPPWSSRAISQSVYRHTGQASSSNQPGQIRPGDGQEFHTPDPPQGQSTHFPQTVQFTRSAHSIHRTKFGRVAQTRSGKSILLQLQLTYILCTEEARARTPDRAGLPATQSALPHRQILHEGDQRMHRGHRAGQLVHLYHSGSHLQILANETGSRVTTPNRF